MGKKIYIILSLLILLTFHGYGQRFSASALLGVTASQIDGDDHAGYSKLGLTGGIRTDYYFEPTMSLGIELLFSQRGAQSSLTLGTPANIQRIHMNFLEIPIMFVYHDWLIEKEKFHKVRGEVGFSYGNRFSISAMDSFFENVVDDFARNDISILFGAHYKFTKRIGITARYTRALNKLYTNEQLLARPLSSYFLTFRFEYHL